MSLWVRVFTNFYTNRKTAKLRSAIGDDAFWVPPRLWAYAAENQPDGDFSKYSPSEVAFFIGYTKDAQAMLQAMLQAGFLDEDMRLHDWAEHNSYHSFFAERARKAASARWTKERTKERGKGVRKERKGKEPSIASSMLEASAAGAADTPHQVFIGLWTEAYKAQFGRDYLFQRAKDGAAVKHLLAGTGRTPAELIEIARRAWSQSALFSCKQAVTIAGFSSRYNEIVAELDQTKSPSKPNYKEGWS